MPALRDFAILRLVGRIRPQKESNIQVEHAQQRHDEHQGLDTEPGLRVYQMDSAEPEETDVV
jgi:hypothetical protein